MSCVWLVENKSELCGRDFVRRGVRAWISGYRELKRRRPNHVIFMLADTVCTIYGCVYLFWILSQVISLLLWDAMH